MKILLLFVHFFVPTQKCLDDFHATYTKVCGYGCRWVNSVGEISFSPLEAEPHAWFVITDSSDTMKNDCYEVFTSTLAAAPAPAPESKEPRP